MKPFDLAIALFSIIIIILGLFYRRLKKSMFNETLLAMLFGIALSPIVLNVLDMAAWGGSKGPIMEKACRLTLAMALMATAFRIPKEYLPSHKRVQCVMLFFVMPAMFLASSAIIHFLFKLNWQLSLLIGAIITPTDPVLAGTIVSGEKANEILPDKTRSTISFESGANDGLAYPFVMLCLLFIEDPGHAWEKWFTKSLLIETGGAIVLGLLLGYVFGLALEFCIKRGFTGKPAILAFALSVGFFVLTALELIHLNSILAVFMTGIMLKRVLGRQEDIEEEEVQEMMARLFTIPVFVCFGLILPWEQWFLLGWTAVALIILILLFRRLPFVFLAKPLLKDFKLKDITFVGWFGPIGVAALYYCFYTYERLHVEHIWNLTSLVVFGSVIAHGLSAFPLLKKYGER